MPFIGNQPALSYTSFAKQDFTTSATTSYTLDQPVANENELALFINFVRQEPTTAYTASGTSLTLTSATSASDDMYCVFLGKAVQTVNPPSGSVGLSQLSATGTKDSTTFLRGDNTFAEVPAGGITEADQWRITTSITTPQSTVADLTTNWERVDTDGFGKIGTGLTESSGIFSFASTGVYYIHAFACFQGKDSNYYNLVLKTTTDNSTYDLASENYCFTQDDNDYSSISLTFMFNVTNITTHKVKFGHRMANTSGVGALQGQTNANGNAFTFIRLGDSV